MFCVTEDCFEYFFWHILSLCKLGLYTAIFIWMLWWQCLILHFFTGKYEQVVNAFHPGVKPVTDVVLNNMARSRNDRFWQRKSLVAAPPTFQLHPMTWVQYNGNEHHAWTRRTADSVVAAVPGTSYAKHLTHINRTELHDMNKVWFKQPRLSSH